MHIDTLSAAEQRVLGCLIEKRFTTPDQYPLTLNALRLACNQSTNREPVVSYGEETVNAAAQRLARYGLVRLASGHSSRATKYRHVADEALGLGREQLALLALLLLRGPQTPGELKGRSERIVQWDSLQALEPVLAGLVAHGYARPQGRRPGQKEDRYAQTLGEPTAARPSGAAGADTETPAGAATGGHERTGAATGEHERTGAAMGELATRLDTLEQRVERLTALLEELTGEPLGR